MLFSSHFKDSNHAFICSLADVTAFYWWRTPSTALPYWRLNVKHPGPLPSSMPCGPQRSGSERPRQSLSARWILDDQQVSPGGRSAAAMTRWWSSSGADRARCPKNLSRNDLIFSETGKQPVMLLTVSFVVCLVYGICGVIRRHHASKASRCFDRVLLLVHVSHLLSRTGRM